jgi:ABC-2 type transport system permease protein
MNLIPLGTIIKKELIRVFRIWKQSLIPPMLTSSLFILIFGYSLGSRISTVSGVSYLEFILPGLVMMGVIMSAHTGTASTLFLSKFQNSVQELLVAPISYWEIIIGITTANLIRSLIVGVGIIGVSLLFTDVQIFNIFILFYFIIFTALLFAFSGIITALWAKDFDQMSVFGTFLITPLTYLGGVFYSIDMLPSFWQSVAKFNPVLYLVDGFRYGFLGISDINVTISAIVLFVLTTIFFVLSVYLLRIGYNIRS